MLMVFLPRSQEVFHDYYVDDYDDYLDNRYPFYDRLIIPFNIAQNVKLKTLKNI